MTSPNNKPLLSICIPTYNRSSWLRRSLDNIFSILACQSDEIEIVVCDNASTDATETLAQSYLHRKDFKYFRNQQNIGMLGNFYAAVNHGSGEFIWLLGDDDIIIPSQFHNIIKLIRSNKDVALLYLNYSYSRAENPDDLIDLEDFAQRATPMCNNYLNKKTKIKNISTINMNFFTAIYCLIIKRDHAVKAYEQTEQGRPFSSIQTCATTTWYILSNLMEETGIWVGKPCVVVSLDVSWMKYASLWILEIYPRIFELSKQNGADPIELNERRIEHLSNIPHWFKQILTLDEAENLEFFSPKNMLNCFKHLPQYPYFLRHLELIYNESKTSNPKLHNVSFEDYCRT